MALEERTHCLTTPEEVDAFLRRHPRAVVFKAGACGTTPRTFRFVEGALAPYPDLPLGIVRVVEARAASDHLERLTGIRHESPQLFLFKDGRAVFDRDHWDIAPEDLEEGLRRHYAEAVAGV